MNSDSKSMAARKHALFASLVKDTVGGWQDMVLQGTLDQCLASGDELDADWAHIVNLETGEAVRSRSRKPGGPPLREVPWSLTGGPLDMPETFHMLLSFEESAKLMLLGGEHWVRAKLAHTDSPSPLGGVRTAMEFLSAIAGRELPLLVVGEQAGWAEQLRCDGLVLAEFTMEATPDGDWAVVLDITDKGHELLSGFTSVGKAESNR